MNHDRSIHSGFRFPFELCSGIFGSQVSAIGYRVRVIRFRYGFGPEPEPGAEYLNLGPEG